MHSRSQILENTPKHHFGCNGGYRVRSCENVRRNFFTPKQCISVPKRTSFASFCLHSGSEMLKNTPKHHFGSNEGYWVCSCRNVRRNFGTPKQSIGVPQCTSFSSFCMHSGSEMLENTTRHHFGSNASYWVRSCENVRRNFGTSKQSMSVPKRTSFSLFWMQSRSQILENTPKHHFGSNGGYWVRSCQNVRRNFFTPKQCISAPKRTSFSSFCMHLGSEMLENTSKHHFGSNGDYWVCWCENVRRNFGTPKHSLIVPKRTSFSSFCMHLGSQMLENTPNIIL